MRKTYSQQFRVTMDLGLHLRPAAAIVKTAHRFDADLTVSCDGLAVNGKSLLSLVTLGATQGTILQFFAEGPDARALIDAISELFARGFDESCSGFDLEEPTTAPVGMLSPQSQVVAA